MHVSVWKFDSVWVFVLTACQGEVSLRCKFQLIYARYAAIWFKFVALKLRNSSLLLQVQIAAFIQIHRSLYCVEGGGL